MATFLFIKTLDIRPTMNECSWDSHRHPFLFTSALNLDIRTPLGFMVGESEHPSIKLIARRARRADLGDSIFTGEIFFSSGLSIVLPLLAQQVRACDRAPRRSSTGKNRLCRTCSAALSLHVVESVASFKREQFIGLQ